jgi:hypothetical protein
MAAGIAASRHFPEFQMISREGKSFFARRIGLSRILRSVPSRSGYLPLHCCAGRPPVETLPDIAARRHLFRNVRTGVRMSPDGPESGFGIGFRFCLALLPRSPRYGFLQFPTLRSSSFRL